MAVFGLIRTYPSASHWTCNHRKSREISLSGKSSVQIAASRKSVKRLLCHLRCMCSMGTMGLTSSTVKQEQARRTLWASWVKSTLQAKASYPVHWNSSSIHSTRCRTRGWSMTGKSTSLSSKSIWNMFQTSSTQLAARTCPSAKSLVKSSCKISQSAASLLWSKRWRLSTRAWCTGKWEVTKWTRPQVDPTPSSTLTYTRTERLIRATKWSTSRGDSFLLTWQVLKECARRPQPASDSKKQSTSTQVWVL